MTKKVALPKIGVNMTEAVIIKWLVKPGQKINDGDPVLEAETDKAVQEIYATESGIVEKLLVSEGDTVQCNEDILLLADDGEEHIEKSPLAEDSRIAQHLQSEPVKNKTKTDLPAYTEPKINIVPKVPVMPSVKIRISPLAKKLARENKIDVTKVMPAVPGDRIVKKDILDYLDNRQASHENILEGNTEVVPLSAIRKTIASRLTQSHLEKPSAALTATVDATSLIALRSKYKEKGIKISIDAFLAKVASKVLKLYPDINAVLEGDNLVRKSDVNVGIAVDTEKGLMVPVIKHADRKSLVEISDEISRLADSAKQGGAHGDALRGGTFTITNLGAFGVEQFTPIINPPECCILAVGAIKRVFVPDAEDKPVLINTMQLTLVFDHRMVDGAPAARFLRDFKYFVELPEMLI